MNEFNRELDDIISNAQNYILDIHGIDRNEFDYKIHREIRGALKNLLSGFNKDGVPKSSELFMPPKELARKHINIAVVNLLKYQAEILKKDFPPIKIAELITEANDLIKAFNMYREKYLMR